MLLLLQAIPEIFSESGGLFSDAMEAKLHDGNQVGPVDLPMWAKCETSNL